MAQNDKYPFSDLTADQMQRLIRAAHSERAEAVRGFLAMLLGRRREAQIWPPKNAPALSLTTYC